MTLIPMEEDGETIATRFRKAHSFAFLVDEKIIILNKNPHKTSKSAEFFEYFKTLGVDTLYIKALGHKTFLTLSDMGVEVYAVKSVQTCSNIRPDTLTLLTKHNAEAFCTLGHFDKEENK